MRVPLGWHTVRCICLVVVVGFEYSLQVYAKTNVTRKTCLESGDNSYNSTSSLTIHCNESEERVSDFDFNFDEMEEDLMALFSYHGDEDNVNQDQTNSSDVETRIKNKGILNLGGRQKILDIVRITKGIYKKNMGTLLLAYKLKFFTLFPLLVAAMMVIVKASGLAGFFFALFIGSVAVKSLSH